MREFEKKLTGAKKNNGYFSRKAHEYRDDVERIGGGAGRVSMPLLGDTGQRDQTAGTSLS